MSLLIMRPFLEQGSRIMCALLISIIMLISPDILVAANPPQLRFESPKTLQPIAQRLQNVDPRRLATIMDLVGLANPGPAIRVILAQDESPLAQQAPRWAAGYARSDASTVVLLTDRVTNYPDDSFESLLSHEIGHILTHRAAKHHPLPRWFDEGLAMLAARTWDLEDRARLVWAMVSGTQLSLEEINAGFLKDGASARHAYVLAHAFLVDLLKHTSVDLPQRLLAQVATGVPFEKAFSQTAFMTLDRAEELFWSRQTLWSRWVPVATSSAVLWMVITALVFYVFRKQRKRNAAIQEQWREEDWDV